MNSLLLNCWQNKSLPHAVLGVSSDKEARQIFAYDFAKLLLCQESTAAEKKACGHCRACHLMAAGTHPDFYLISPLAESKNIAIDQIRDLIKGLVQTPQQNRYKVVVIDPAESLQIAAVNALLKTLEEPTPDTFILLLCQQPSLLPATLRSRCQVFSFEKQGCHRYFPLERESLDQLSQKLCDMAAQKITPLELAALYSKNFSLECLDNMSLIVSSAIYVNLGLPFLECPATKIFTEMNTEQLFILLDKLYSLRRAVMVVNSLNGQLLLEEIFCSVYSCLISCLVRRV